MNLRIFIDSISRNKNSSNAYFRPNIPKNKLSGAIASYGGDMDPDEVLFLLDDTVFGGAREGMMITEAGFYSKELGSVRCVAPIEKISTVSIKKNQISINSINFFKSSLDDEKSIGHFIQQLNSFFLDSSSSENESAEGRDNLEQEVIESKDEGEASLGFDRGLETMLMGFFDENIKSIVDQVRSLAGNAAVSWLDRDENILKISNSIHKNLPSFVRGVITNEQLFGFILKNKEHIIDLIVKNKESSVGRLSLAEDADGELNAANEVLDQALDVFISKGLTESECDEKSDDEDDLLYFLLKEHLQIVKEIKPLSEDLNCDLVAKVMVLFVLYQYAISATPFSFRVGMGDGLLALRGVPSLYIESLMEVAARNGMELGFDDDGEFFVFVSAATIDPMESESARNKEFMNEFHKNMGVSNVEEAARKLLSKI